MSDIDRKKIGEMTLQDAHEYNVADMQKAQELGLITDAGRIFANKLNTIVHDTLLAAGLGAVEFAVLMPQIANLTADVQGAIDLKGVGTGEEGGARKTSQAAMAFIMTAIKSAATHAKMRKAESTETLGSTDASFSDFDPSVPPNLYN